MDGPVDALFLLRQHRNFWLLTCLIVGVGMMVVLREYVLLPDGKAHAIFLDVGQGDAILLKSPSGKRVLIDTGPDASVLSGLGRTLPFFDRHIDLVIITHPDSDHLGGLPEVLRRYDVASVLLTPSALAETSAAATRALLVEEKSRIIFPDPERDIDLGDGLSLDILWPPKALALRESKDPNELSVVLRAHTAERSVLCMGDLPVDQEEQLLMQGNSLASDVLKIGHHGSDTSSSDIFLREVHPSLAVISVGKGNRFGHPKQVILERLAAWKIPVRSTASEGMIALDF